jgi:hypothetical protein
MLYSLALELSHPFACANMAGMNQEKQAHDARLADQRIAFGLLLLNWRRRNGWSGRTPSEWADHCPELLLERIGNSAWSRLENGRGVDTPPCTFEALGMMNKLLAQEYRGKLPPGELRRRIYEGKPIEDETHGVWGTAEFFCAFLGYIEIPEEYVSRTPVINVEEASRVCGQWQKWFERTVKTESLAPHEALQEIKNYIGEMPLPFYRKLTQVLIGFEVFSPEEMMAMRIGDEDKYMPDAALAEWAQDSGIDGPIRRT